MVTIFRALQLLTKRSFQPPGLQHRNKWSNNFHDFVSHCLKKDTSKRPTAKDLLKASTCYIMKTNNVIIFLNVLG